MAEVTPQNICEVDGDKCNREVRALCYHCSKNLCQFHFRQHAQLIESEMCRQLNSFADAFNELLAQFDALSISPDILKRPFDQIEQWRVDSHAKIDQIAEKKRQEIDVKIHEYREIFAIKNEEQVMKIKTIRTSIHELIQEADASRKQVDDLQASMDEIRKYLKSVSAHEIQVDTCQLQLSVDIYPKFFDSQPQLKEVNVGLRDLREFRIKYIHLNGFVREYSIKTKKTGTMKDLINSFIRQSCAHDRAIVFELKDNYTTYFDPKHDFILGTGIYNHELQKPYGNDDKLDSILDRDEIAFYETPYSMFAENNPRILMPCIFQRLPKKQPFAWPIYLDVPRQKCRGQDIRDALRATIDRYFPIDPDKNQQLYNATLKCFVPDTKASTTKSLNDILQDTVDFIKANVSVIVTIDANVADMYEQNMTKQSNFKSSLN